MTSNLDLWDVPELTIGLILRMQAEEDPAMRLVQHENRVRMKRAHVKELVAALMDGAADLVEVLASGGVYHAQCTEPERT